MNIITHTMSAFAQICAARASSQSLRSPRWTPEQTRQARRFLWTSLAAVAFYVLFTHLAWGAESLPVGGKIVSFTLFDSIDTEAKAQSSTWFNTILGLVKPTFLALATIEICWAATIWALEKDNLNSLAVEFIKKIMFIGFFYALLQYAPEWIPTITGTFQQVGQTAARTSAVTTDGIIALSLAVIELVWSKAPTGGWTDILSHLGQIFIACFASIGIVIAYVVVAAQYFTLKIESYILFAAGAIFLGLGSSSWTKEYVSKYLNYAINVGVRLLVLILILSLTLSAVTKKGDSFEFEYPRLLELLAIAILQAILSIKAPEMAGALLNGGIGLSAGSAMGAGSSAFSTMKMAAGAAAGGAGLALGAGMSAVQGIGNMRKAIGAGREIAKQEGKSGVSATLSGLGKATAQAGREGGQMLVGAVKALPGKLRDAGKGNTKTAHGTNPGLFDRTKKTLEDRANNSAAEKAGGGAAVKSITAPNKPRGTTRPPSLSKGSTTGQQPSKSFNKNT